jgi:two-component system, chemotaxis family, protein-glutamate methylesterase/glutaminase
MPDDNRPTREDGTLRVLVVDDSAYVRKVVSQMLNRSPLIEVVGTARDGEEALEQVERLQPDVVTLDLIMPRMDGVAFLEAQMERRPLPVVVVSIAGEGGEMALRALDAGATDFVQKPTALATERVLEMSDELIEKVRGAAAVRLAPVLTPQQARAGGAADSPRVPGKGLVDVVVLGISTGGPQALRYLIPQFPADFRVPIAVVLHMPIGYTEMYARRLNEISALSVDEAHEGEVLQPGHVLIAPAGRHLTLQSRPGGNIVAHLDARPFDTRHRPSVDVLFRSSAEVCQQRVLGVVMTGMGSDGLQGAAWIKAQEGLVFTEAESSCVVYGMPRVVVEAGLSDRSVPLEFMAGAIQEVV